VSNTAPQSSNSDSTLSQLPARVLTFLTAIGTRAPIRAALYQAGYRPEDHDEGWRLLMATGNIRARSPNIAAQNRANLALAAIHTWVSSHFHRFRVALDRLHPEHASLFPAVDPRYPTESLLAMATLVAALQRGNPSRDAALMNTIAQRSLDAIENARLAQLVSDAQYLDATPAANDTETDDRTSDLVALYYWYRDWAESAKRFISRKDYWAKLGIGAKHVPLPSLNPRHC
jgi:hypothetical protein